MWFFFLIFSSTVFSNFAPRYNRTINQVRDGPATAGNALLALLDPGHAKASAIYNMTWFNQFMAEGRTHLGTQFGIIGLVPNPAMLGSYIHPIGTLFPIGPNVSLPIEYLIAADSKYPNRSSAGEPDWLIAEFGFLFLITSAGVYPGGTQVGYVYKPTELLAWTEYNYLKSGENWTSPDCYPHNCRERVALASLQASSTMVNSQRLQDQFVNVRATTIDGVGTTLGAINNYYLDGNSAPQVRIRITTTIPH